MFAEETPKYEDLTAEIITVTESTEEQNYENPGVSLQLPHFEPALTDQFKQKGEAWMYELPPL